MAADLKGKTISGVIWTAFEKFFRKFVQFGIGIVLARLLAPSEYGVVGMLSIFIAVAQTFIDSGMGNALIQKKEKLEQDFSTVFYFNIAVSFLFYVLLFVCSPFIASFYRMPVLEDVTKVISITLLINALTAVHTTKLTIDLRFKELSFASVSSAVVSGIAGIILAYYGYGVWAIVYQTIIMSIVNSLVVYYYVRWQPKLEFSKDSFNKLFSFGSKLLCSGLINTIYNNLYTLVIGRAFSPADVGFYNRANQFSLLPVSTIQDMSTKVSYPVLSKMQDDDSKLINAYKKLLRHPLYILFPVLVGLAVVAEPLIVVMIGEKWLPCVRLMQIMCIGYMFAPLSTTNLNLLYVKGRTDLVLKLEFFKKPIAFIILFSSLYFGLVALVIGRAFMSSLPFLLIAIIQENY